MPATVVSANAINHSGSKGWEGGSYIRTYTVVWRVIMSDLSATEKLVLELAHLPPYNMPIAGSIHSEDTGAWAHTARPVQDNNEPHVWLVTIEFSSKRTKVLNKSYDPFSEPYELRWTFQGQQIPAVLDIDGYTISNGAAQRFDPPEMELEYSGTLSVTRNETTYDPTRVLDYIDSVNDADWNVLGKTCPKLSARMLKFDGERQHHGNVNFWRVSYEFNFKRPLPAPAPGTYRYVTGTGGDPSPHDLILLNQGPMYRDGATHELKYAYTNDGQVIPNIMLKLDGTWVGLNSTAQYYLVFKRRPRKNFSALAFNWEQGIYPGGGPDP